MIPRTLAAALLLAIGGTVILLWTVVGPSLERRHMTEARRRELEDASTSQRTGHPWEVVAPVFLIGVPALFVVDGLVFRIGLLYAPYLSFFHPLDTVLQGAGVALSSLGILLMVVAGRTLVREVFSKAVGEREMVTSGIYAHVRHPFYLSFVLLPLGMWLLTLNVVGILFLPPFLFFTNGDLEACGRRGKLTFLLKAIECEEMALVQRYGEAYEAYRARTGRFLPRLRR